LSTSSLYKEILLNHFRHPRNKGRLPKADLVARGRNPRCGDDIEIEVKLQGDRLDQVMFSGRGCSVCMASASIMTSEVVGKSIGVARDLCQTMDKLFNEGEKQEEALAMKLEGDLNVLSAVKEVPARRHCVLLSWQALSDALALPQC